MGRGHFGRGRCWRKWWTIGKGGDFFNFFILFILCITHELTKTRKMDINNNPEILPMSEKIFKKLVNCKATESWPYLGKNFLNENLDQIFIQNSILLPLINSDNITKLKPLSLLARTKNSKEDKEKSIKNLGSLHKLTSDSCLRDQYKNLQSQSLAQTCNMNQNSTNVESKIFPYACENRLGSTKKLGLFGKDQPVTDKKVTMNAKSMKIFQIVTENDDLSKIYINEAKDNNYEHLYLTYQVIYTENLTIKIEFSQLKDEASSSSSNGIEKVKNSDVYNSDKGSSVPVAIGLLEYKRAKKSDKVNEIMFERTDQKGFDLKKFEETVWSV